jgi:hypothetical protein
MSRDRAQASLCARKMYFISNVLVLLDPRNPENEGKVYLYKYGRTIMDKIEELMTPLSDTEGVDPFDPEFGANFRLRAIQKTGEYPDYSRSSFDPPSSIGNEDFIATVLSRRQSLESIIAPSQFKSYEQLKQKFEDMLSMKNSA